MKHVSELTDQDNIEAWSNTKLVGMFYSVCQRFSIKHFKIDPISEEDHAFIVKI